MIQAQEIKNYVEEHREEALRCLTEIIQTPSVTGNEEEVSHVFEKWIEQAGLEVQRIYSAPGRPNLIADWNGDEAGGRFLFNGHMDVFPPSLGDDCVYGPWSAKIVDGYMYGRGTGDMKGGDCAALMAVTFLKRMGFRPKGTVSLSYMSDEENGGWLGAKYLTEHGYLKADVGICMEPTRGMILNNHYGILRLKFTYHAAPHHAGSPHPSTDALEKAVAAINRLYALDHELTKRTDAHGNHPSCLSVTVLHAGNTPNVQPGLAEFIVDRRLDLSESVEFGLKQILEIFDELKAKDPEYDYAYELLSDRPCLTIDDDDPFIQTAVKSYEQIMGEPGRLYVRSGGSDAATIRCAHGTVIPNWGVASDFGEFGSGTPNERISVQGYLDSIKYYMMTVVNTMSPEE